MILENFKKIILNKEIDIEKKKKILQNISIKDLKEMRYKLLTSENLNQKVNSVLFNMIEKRLETIIDSEDDLSDIGSFNPLHSFHKFNSK